MPEARVIYRESGGKIPSAETLRLEFPRKGYYDYEVEAFKALDQRVETVE
jgi:hypothetical protein